jgi:DNA-binding transcriptional MerR regulator
MDGVIPEKAYFRIGEVSTILNVEPYVIRYWEKEFKNIKPIRTKTGQRLYRKKDVLELLKIRDLLYRQKFTIDGARKQLLKIKDTGRTGITLQNHEMLMLIKKELQEIRNLVREQKPA